MSQALHDDQLSFCLIQYLTARRRVLIEERKESFFLSFMSNRVTDDPKNEIETHDAVYKVMVKEFHYRPEMTRGFQEVKLPRLRDNGREWW